MERGKEANRCYGKEREWKGETGDKILGKRGKGRKKRRKKFEIRNLVPFLLFPFSLLLLCPLSISPLLFLYYLPFPPFLHSPIAPLLLLPYLSLLPAPYLSPSSPLSISSFSLQYLYWWNQHRYMKEMTVKDVRLRARVRRERKRKKREGDGWRGGGGRGDERGGRERRKGGERKSIKKRGRGET